LELLKQTFDRLDAISDNSSIDVKSYSVEKVNRKFNNDIAMYDIYTLSETITSANMNIIRLC